MLILLDFHTKMLIELVENGKKIPKLKLKT